LSPSLWSLPDIVFVQLVCFSTPIRNLSYVMNFALFT
jgi:hypothetical protein